MTTAFLFGFGKHDLEDMQANLVFIGMASTWEEEGFLSDHYDDEHDARIRQMEQKLGISELMESVFEIPEEATVEEIKAALLQEPDFKYDPAFEQFNNQ